MIGKQANQSFERLEGAGAKTGAGDLAAPREKRGTEFRAWSDSIPAEPFLSSGGTEEALGRAAHPTLPAWRGPLAALPLPRPRPRRGTEPSESRLRGKEKTGGPQSSKEPGSRREPVCFPETLTSPPVAHPSGGWRNRPFRRGHLEALLLAPAPPVGPPPAPPRLGEQGRRRFR